jgi:hypothetical protein
MAASPFRGVGIGSSPRNGKKPAQGFITPFEEFS